MDVSNSTALHAAAIVNYAAGVAELLSGAEAAGMGLSIGKDAWALRLDAEGSTALHIAAAAGFTDVVEALLDGFVNISFYPFVCGQSRIWVQSTCAVDKIACGVLAGDFACCTSVFQWSASRN
jgi:ankyrin repeat protein